MIYENIEYLVTDVNHSSTHERNYRKHLCECFVQKKGAEFGVFLIKVNQKLENETENMSGRNDHRRFFCVSWFYLNLEET